MTSRRQWHRGDDTTFRQLDPERDRRTIAALWGEAMGPEWPVLPLALNGVHSGLVAEVEGRVIGAAGRSGSALLLILVAPRFQRRGIGSRLLEAMRVQAAEDGHAHLGLGSGGDDRIWPGVPTECAGGIAFFERHGYAWEHEAIDLVAPAQGWVPPSVALSASTKADVRLDHAERAPADVLEFEAAQFPNWLRAFSEPEGETILVARGRTDGRVVGSLLWAASGSPFVPALQEPCGSIGCVGTDVDLRGRGIATALVLEATQRIAESGAATCHIGWAWQTGLYERCGYTTWRRYLMDRRPS